jgi:hypothetical protein
VRVSWNFFHMLGVRPAIGRDFRQDEDTDAGWRVVTINSDRFSAGASGRPVFSAAVSAPDIGGLRSSA